MFHIIGRNIHNMSTYIQFYTKSQHNCVTTYFKIKHKSQTPQEKPMTTLISFPILPKLPSNFLLQDLAANDYMCNEILFIVIPGQFIISSRTERVINMRAVTSITHQLQYYFIFTYICEWSIN